MKKLTYIIAFLLIISLCLFTGCGGENKADNKPANYINVDAGTLLQDLYKNAMNAKKEHNGKDYAILGRVVNINIDGKGFDILPTKVNWNKTNIACLTTNDAQKDKLSKYKNGDLILVKGKITAITEKTYTVKIKDIEIPTATAVAGISDTKLYDKNTPELNGGNYYESVSGVHLGMIESEVKNTIGNPSALLSEEETVKQFDDAYRKSWYYKKQGLLIQYHEGKVCNIVILNNSPLHLDRSGLNRSNSLEDFKAKYPNAKGNAILNIAKGEYLFLNDLKKGKITLSIYNN